MFRLPRVTDSIHNEPTTIADRFRRLIQSLSLKFNEKVVVIIDEYDKPHFDMIKIFPLILILLRFMRVKTG
ncbi:MAG: AAA family ATPase [Spirochaetaceae bacterium]|nr:AAA family ATPase [Spirochaetaceae bacterium]